jgi:hypothetical protein
MATDTGVERSLVIRRGAHDYYVIPASMLDGVKVPMEILERFERALAGVPQAERVRLAHDVTHPPSLAFASFAHAVAAEYQSARAPLAGYLIEHHFIGEVLGTWPPPR